MSPPEVSDDGNLLCQRLADADEDSGVREATAQALGKLAPHLPLDAAKRCVDALVQRLVDKDSDVRQAAANALFDLSKQAPLIYQKPRTITFKSQFYTANAPARHTPSNRIFAESRKILSDYVTPWIALFRAGADINGLFAVDHALSAGQSHGRYRFGLHRVRWITTVQRLNRLIAFNTPIHG